jgi:hypothetical protein
MDPKANLKEQLEIASWFLDVECEDRSDDIALDLAVRLAELVRSLDEWMRAGGFSPYAPEHT